MSTGNYTLIDKITLVSILFVGIIITYFQYSDYRNLDVLNESYSDSNPKESLLKVRSYMEFIPSLLLVFGVIFLLIKPNKIAWRITYIPLLFFTLYFSYSVLYTLLSENSNHDILAVKLLSFGFIISINFILLLFCFFLLSNSFKEKINA